MVRALIVLLVVAGSLTFMTAARGQEADVTFEGQVAETITLTEGPGGPMTVGPGSIRITLTPSLNGVLRAEVVDVVASVEVPVVGLVEHRLTGDRYYWPPIPIEDGTFAVGVSVIDIGAVRRHVKIEGEVVSASEMRGTLYDSLLAGPSTTWVAGGPVDTPPGPEDRVFHASVEGGGTISVALNPAQPNITAFDLDDLPLDPCLPDETLSVRAFSDLGNGRLSHSSLVGEGTVFVGGTVVGIRDLRVDGSEASGTLFWGAGLYADDCEFAVRWQTEPFTTAEPTATAQPTATSTPGPTELPAAGHRRGGALPIAGWAMLAAFLGVGLALLGRGRLRT